MSSVLPFIVFSFTGSARDSVPKALSEGAPELGRRLNSDSPRARAGRGAQKLADAQSSSLPDFYPGVSPLSRVVLESPIISLHGLGTGMAISRHWGIVGNTP